MNKDIDYKKIDNLFIKERWNLTSKILDEKESRFMEQIRYLLWKLGQDPEDEGSISKEMNSCYDASSLIKHIAKIVEQYQDIFHILHASCCFSEEYDKEVKSND